MTTIKDIARVTGLSIATISKYINGGTLREKNRAAIESAIRELGYERNEVARALKVNKSMTVGVILPNIDNIFATTIVSRIQRILQECGYGTIVCESGYEPGGALLKTEFLLRKKVDGLICMPQSLESDYIRLALNRDVSVVLMDRIVDIPCDAVLIDNAAAAYTAAEYLLSMGHRRIGVIGEQSVYTSRERYRGFVQAHTDAGLHVDDSLLKMGNLMVEGGYQAFTQLWEQRRDITAVFSLNYEMTLGAVIACYERGIRLGTDLSFVGFDDMELIRIVRPPLTTVAQPVDDIARRTANLLLKRIRGQKDDFPNVEILSAEFFARQTVKNMLT